MRVIASAMPPPVQDSAVVTVARSACSASPSRCAREVSASIESSSVTARNPTPEGGGWLGAAVVDYAAAAPDINRNIGVLADKEGVVRPPSQHTRRRGTSVGWIALLQIGRASCRERG